MSLLQRQIEKDFLKLSIVCNYSNWVCSYFISLQFMFSSFLFELHTNPALLTLPLELLGIQFNYINPYFVFHIKAPVATCKLSVLFLIPLLSFRSSPASGCSAAQTLDVLSIIELPTENDNEPS